MTDRIQLESPQALVNRARFVGRDFFTVVDDIVARLKENYPNDFNNFVVSGTGMMLVDIVAWAVELLSFYGDRQATESYLSVARTLRAAERLTRPLGYKIRGSVASSVDLQVRLQTAQTFAVPVPEGYKFKGPNGLTFSATETVTFPIGEGPQSAPRTISVREGVTKSETFTSNGQRDQVFRLSPGENRAVAYGTVKVMVNAVEWAESDFITYDATNQYEIVYTGSPALRFGNGVAGNIPVLGAQVVITYTATSGAGGQVMARSIQDVAEALVVSFTQVKLLVDNEDPSSGGDDPEPLDSIRTKAPAFRRTAGAAVTEEDYIGLSDSYADPLAGAIAVSKAIVARSADQDLYLINVLTGIRANMATLRADVQAQTAIAATETTTAQAALTNIQTLLASLQTHVDAVYDGAAGYTVDARDEFYGVRTRATEIQAAVTAGLAAGTLALKDAQFTIIQGLASTITSSVGVGVTALADAEQEMVDASADIAAAVSSASAAQSSLALVQTSVAAIDTRIATDFETAISAQLDLIFAHVDGFLAEDCQANLVQVPILTRDVEGFFAAPSTALIRSLQAYLDERKEVTQTVEVLSGEAYLVLADITATVGVRTGYVRATVVSNVRKAFEGVLRDRPFGKSLRLSDLYASIAPDPVKGTGGVEGVQYAVVRIVGPAQYLSVDGDLIIDSTRVISRGVITLTSEAAS
jgi:hypothetical protein